MFDFYIYIFPLKYTVNDHFFYFVLMRKKGNFGFKKKITIYEK